MPRASTLSSSPSSSRGNPGLRGVRICEGITTAGLILFTGATPFSIAISQSGLCLAGLAWLVRAALLRRWLPARTPLDLPLLAYVAAELLAAVFSLDRHHAFIYLRRVLLIPVIYLVGSHLRTPRVVAAVLAPLFMVSSLCSGIALVWYLLGPGGLEERIRFTQIYMTTAGILMIVICLGAGILLWGPPGRFRWPLASALGLMAVCVVFTYTRSVWLGLAGASLVLFPFRRKRVVLMLAAVLVIAWAAAPASLKERALSSFEPSHPRNVERVRMWSTGLKIWRDYPLTGIGDIGTAEIYREYMPADAREIAGHLHNNLIHLAVTVGALGLAAVVWLFWRVFMLEISLCRRLKGRRTLARGLARGSLAALVAFHIEGLFEWNFGDAEVVTLLWFSVGLVLAAARLTGVGADPALPGRGDDGGG